MPKIPDLSDLTKKLGLENIMGSVKGIIDGVTAPAKPLDKSEIDAKFAELVGLVQELADVHNEQAKAIRVIHQKINHLIQDVRIIETAVVQPNNEAELDLNQEPIKKTKTKKTAKTTK